MEGMYVDFLQYVDSDKYRMAPTTVEAKHTQQVLMGKQWLEPAVLEEAMSAMEKVNIHTKSLLSDLELIEAGF